MPFRMWRDIAWHRRLTGRIKASSIDTGRNADPWRAGHERHDRPHCLLQPLAG